MKNLLICKNCGTENSFYKFNCTKCNAILRERIVNIDLWHTLNIITDTPAKAFSKIIQAEHKNFIFFIASLFIIKVFINTIILSEQLFARSGSMIVILLLSTLAAFGFIAGAAYLLKASLRIFKTDTRYMDDYSVVTYSLVPYVYALVFLFPVEITLFGGYLFSSNPSPFELKLMPSYILIGLELLMVLWSIILLFFAVKVNSGSTIFSIILALLIGSLFFALPFLLSIIYH